MKILITGAAGFIGYHTCNYFLKNNHKIIGIDNFNTYYDIKLKRDRVKNLKKKYNNGFKLFNIDLNDNFKLSKLFKKEKFDVVINLAAQAGVRYSLKNPTPYINSNIKGFVNILEKCKKYKIKNFVFASSSSVYGKTKKNIFSEKDKAISPLSLYASTKRCNEIIAHSYSHLYSLKITGLRFFTVYGPWGRPDMAYYKFVKNILERKPIKIYNYGNHTRDFSYIDHIVKGIYLVALEKTKKKKTKSNNFEIYNLANGKPQSLKYLINVIEKKLKMKSDKNYVGLQQGDVEKTFANTTKFVKDYGIKGTIDLERGISIFIKWFKSYYKYK